jgi:ABC-type transporter Mla maintaining outer membrane lipid asymmetry permease subunit MlaE
VGHSTIRAVVLALALIFVADLCVTFLTRDGII